MKNLRKQFEEKNSKKVVHTFTLNVRLNVSQKKS